MSKAAKWSIALFLAMIPGLTFAESLINQIQGLATVSPTVRGKFSQTKVLSGVSKKLNSEGFFIVDRNQGVLWVTEKPIYQTLKVSTAGIRISNKAGVLMNLDARNEPSIKYISELVLAIFSGDMVALEKLFNYSGDFTSKGWSLDLTPKNSSSVPFKKISISGDKAIGSITFISKEGDLTEISFVDVLPASTLSKDEALQFQ